MLAASKQAAGVGLFPSQHAASTPGCMRMQRQLQRGCWQAELLSSYARDIHARGGPSKLETPQSGADEADACCIFQLDRAHVDAAYTGKTAVLLVALMRNTIQAASSLSSPGQDARGCGVRGHDGGAAGAAAPL